MINARGVAAVISSRVVNGELWLRLLSGPDIDALGLSNAEIVAAVKGAVRAHGPGRVVVEPRVHLVPGSGGAGHFNVLRGHLGEPGVSGVKVVGDFVTSYAAGLPSELRLLTLYDPRTGVPLAIMDATLITACRTGAMTAVGARYLARPASPPSACSNGSPGSAAPSAPIDTDLTKKGARSA